MINSSNFRPTWAEIDTGAFVENIKKIKKLISKKVGIITVIKADGYGHGMIRLARLCKQSGAAYLGLATVDEGIAIRESGINTPVIILGSLYPFSSFTAVIDYNLSPTIASFEGALALSHYAMKKKKRVKVHLKIDTGMGRIGMHPKRAVDFFSAVSKLPCIEVEGVYTHFPSADRDNRATVGQIRIFRKIMEKIKNLKIGSPFFHASNSAAVMKYPEAHVDLVRPGLALYGLEPFPGARRRHGLKPVLKLKTKVIFWKWVEKGTKISYGGTWKASKKSLIATLPIGYGDGYSRLLSNRGEVLVKGYRFPIVGRVCMDMCMIDITKLGKVSSGEEVVLIGSQGKEEITVEEIAEKMGTINYEVTCLLGKRVPRIYVK